MQDTDFVTEDLDGLNVAMYLPRPASGTVTKPEGYVFLGHVIQLDVPEEFEGVYDQCIQLTTRDGKQIHFCREGLGFWYMVMRDPFSNAWCFAGGDRDSCGRQRGYEHDVII